MEVDILTKIRLDDTHVDLVSCFYIAVVRLYLIKTQRHNTKQNQISDKLRFISSKGNRCTYQITYMTYIHVYTSRYD